MWITSSTAHDAFLSPDGKYLAAPCNGTGYRTDGEGVIMCRVGAPVVIHNHYVGGVENANVKQYYIGFSPDGAFLASIFTHDSSISLCVVQCNDPG
jgi:hypothetical protein